MFGGLLGCRRLAMVVDGCRLVGDKDFWWSTSCKKKSTWLSTVDNRQFFVDHQIDHQHTKKVIRKLCDAPASASEDQLAIFNFWLNKLFFPLGPLIKMTISFYFSF